MPRRDAVDDRPDLSLVGDVQPVRRAAPDLVCDLPRGVLVDVADRDLRARLRQRLGRRPPDAAAATGDQSHPAVQPQ